VEVEEEKEEEEEEVEEVGANEILKRYH